ncbi:MAG: hypothetical protein U1B30_01070, partial [Pseudomonadota bacterium]|nr:hypothetical protein [Pseudomonadota bacterium]
MLPLTAATIRRFIPSYLLLALISIFVISGLSVSGKTWADTVYQRTTAHSFGSNYDQFSSTAGGTADVTSTLCNAARCTANSTYLFYPGADHNTSDIQTANPQRGWAIISPVNGTIPAGTWTFRWAVEVQQFTTGGTATVSARVFRATNGTNGTLLFTVNGSRNYATATSAAVTETINSAQTAYSLAANEYLVVEYWMNYNATGDYAFRLQSNTANNYVIYPPPQTTLGTGTDPSNTSLAPGGTSTLADAFSFQTSSGTDVITAATVTFAAGTAGGLALVEITNVAGTTVYGSVANPGSDTPAITLSTNTLTATTTLTEYRIRVTPKTHANMPAPPGSSYAVTARISAFTSTNGQTGSDTAGTTVTIDNLSPGNVTAATATAGNTQTSLAWSNPASGDLHSIIVLRRATSAVADVPVEGSTYTVGNTIGTATVACVVAVAGTSCNDTGLTNGTAYHYKIFAKDNSGNYSATGVIPTGSPATPMVTVSGTVYIDEGV